MSDPTANDVQDPAGPPPATAGGQSDAPAATTTAAGADTSDEPPKPRKRRRRRGRGKSGDGAQARAQGTASDSTPAASEESPTTDAPPPALPSGLAALAGGLLSHLDERQIRCSSDGCDNTWTWTAAEQIQAMGQPAPKRLCSGCSNVADREVRCMVEGCKRTWTWNRSAQLKHRTWKRRSGGQPQHDRKRRRKQEGTPRRRCDLCQQKATRLGERQGACKVHGCTRTVTIEKELQLRSWATLGTKDLDAEGPLAKKMCEVCREFCRTHPDRPVECGRPGCDRSWPYKTGAQLQAFLAGRLEDPMRLACEGSDCDLIKAEAAQLAQIGGSQVGSGRNTEIMPCVVIGCDGAWSWRPNMVIPPCNDGDQPVQRMCETHRTANGGAARPEPEAIESKENVDPPALEVSGPDGSVESAESVPPTVAAADVSDERATEASTEVLSTEPIVRKPAKPDEETSET